MYVTVEQNLEAVLYFASSECVAGSYWARQLCIISLEPHNHWPWLSTALYIFTAPSQLCFSSASPSSNCMSNQCSSVQPSTKTWARCRSMCFIWFPFTLLQPLYQHTAPIFLCLHSIPYPPSPPCPWFMPAPPPSFSIFFICHAASALLSARSRPWRWQNAPLYFSRIYLLVSFHKLMLLHKSLRLF